MNAPLLGFTVFNKTTWRIVQLLPAAGWMAVYAADDTSEVLEPLVGWALMESPMGEQEVRGLIDMGGYIDEVSGLSEFQGYRKDVA